MEGDEWASRARDNFIQIENLKEWVDSEIRMIEHQTAQVSHQRSQIKDEIRQLKLQITESQAENPDPQTALIMVQIQELKTLKQSNSRQIEQLRHKIAKTRQKHQHQVQLMSKDKLLSAEFDAHIGAYAKLNEIYSSLELKSRLISILLSQVSAAK